MPGKKHGGGGLARGCLADAAFELGAVSAARRRWRPRRHVRRRFRRAGSPRRRAGAWRRLVVAERQIPGRRPLANIRAEPGSSRMRTATFWRSCNTCAQAARAHVVGGDIFAGVCCTASVCRLAELIRNAAPCISSFWLCARRRISAGSSQGGACDGLHTGCVRCDRTLSGPFALQRLKPLRKALRSNGFRGRDARCRLCCSRVVVERSVGLSGEL